MAERSFSKEIGRLHLGAGETFQGEGILAVTKALLQNGVSYIGGYPGAPISHMIDIMNDAAEIRSEYGVHFENCASEAGAAAMLAASIHYPIRGAVTWKSTVGTNVASDALASIASAGVCGGALIIIGEDYGEGSSIMQERTHPFAMKSQIWLLDPRPDLPFLVDMVGKSFELSEASNTPVMLMMRIRTCHVYGEFTASDNQRGKYNAKNPITEAIFDYSKVVLPPSSYQQEIAKIEERWPAAVDFIRENKLNEVYQGDVSDIGLIVQGGLYNNLIRALQILNLADDFGKTRISIYVMNVAYPMVPDEILNFCAGKKSVLMVEEGYPNYLEQALNDLLRRSEMEDGDIEVRTHIYGKGTLPNVGELKPAEILLGLSKFIAAASSADLDNTLVASISNDYIGNLESAAAAVNTPLPTRPPGFCTGCPERPLFSAIKLLEKELGPTHVCGDIGCNLFGSLEPFNTIQHTVGYGLSLSSASGIAPNFGKRVMTIMGDGGFWHNGLTSGVANAVYNGDDGVLVIVDNGYAAATGHHVIPSSGVNAAGQKVDMSIENALRGVGVTWVKTVYNYDVDELVDVLREALTTSEGGIKTIIGNAECMLAKQRRVKSQFTDGLVKGERVMRTRFGIDEDVCTGDHRCIRLSGCPSLTLRDNPNPLIPDPVAHIDNSCVGCGNCGAVVHEAGLCPSFFKVDVVTNPSRWERAMEGFRSAVIGALQGGRLA